MKKLSLILCIVLAISVLIPITVFAADVTTYTSGIQVQNLSTTDEAEVQITFYNSSDGSIAATQDATIPAGSSSTFFPLNAVSSGYDGSAVISSTQPVAAIVNVLGNGTEHAASYGGFTGGALAVNIPLIQKNNYGINSFFNVQNVGTTGDANVTVTYPGTACTEDAVIPQGAAHKFDQSTNTCLPDGPGAATVTSDKDIVATVMQVQSNSSGLQAALLAYNAFATSGSTAPVMPLVSSGWYGSITGIQIQNTGGTSTNVTVTYTPSDGFPGVECDETKAIPAGQSVTFGLSTGNLLPAACRSLQSGYNAFIGTAEVTANSASQNLVAIVNQINSTNAQAASYAAFDPASGTTTVNLPLLADRNYGIFSGFSVMNVGDDDATINCTFSDSTVTASGTVGPGESLTAVQQNAIANGYVGAATCTSNEPVVAVVNYLDPGSVTGALDGLSVYEGINPTTP
jgi:hypothetical protein